MFEPWHEFVIITIDCVFRDIVLLEPSMPDAVVNRILLLIILGPRFTQILFIWFLTMGVQRRTRKFAQVKRTISKRDARLETLSATTKGDEDVQVIPQQPSSLFFSHNCALGPPYSILVDTNFISQSVKAKLDMLSTFMDLLYTKCSVAITDCVLAEMEKLGNRYSIALRITKDERWERLTCNHKGTYADDCIVSRVTKHRVYFVATNDRDLKRRIRKIPGVPLISVNKGKYLVERLPDVL